MFYFTEIKLYYQRGECKKEVRRFQTTEEHKSGLRIRKNVFNSTVQKIWTIPMTQLEFNSWKKQEEIPDGPMRFINKHYTTERLSGSEEITVTQYMPNRHQRKYAAAWALADCLNKGE